MPKNYEMTLIVDTQLAEGSVDEIVARYETLVGEHGTIFNVDRWGARKLAYDIRKRQQGDYTFVQFHAEPAVIGEIDRACRLDDTILRHLIITVPGGFEAKKTSAADLDDESDEDDLDSDDTEEDSE
jgi:small subunit ribosomal protein S6